VHDRVLAADLDSISDFERLLAAEVAGRDHLLAAAEPIAIADPSHRDQQDTRNETPIFPPCSFRTSRSTHDIKFDPAI